MASKPYFDEVNSQADFPKLENELLKDWDKKGIVKKYLNRNNKSKKIFSFMDGPITANNPMGVHHAWGRTYKDVWQRFNNMRGYRQRFQNGFDCQGLWVEVEVEKELGFKSKKDIEDFGVEKFVKLCRDRVKKYSDIQTTQSKRLGYFMDWDNSYYTLSEDNNYMIWHFLKVCNENGWIYKGEDVVPWCPRCETAISEHETLTEDYKEVTHDSIYIAFPLVGSEDEYLLAWTTTPWTVPANIAVALNPDLEYSQVEVDHKKYWLAKDAVERVMEGVKYKKIKETPGSKLVGLRYEGPFDTLPIVAKVAAKSDKFHTVVATDNFIMPINTDEGTGLVHTSTGTGAEDHRLGEKIKLPMIPAIDDNANYLHGFGEFEGRNAKKHPEIIIDYLKKKDDGKFLFAVKPYTHRYPSCWRCKTELVWKVTSEWYISMDKPAKVHKGKKLLDLNWNEKEKEPEVPDTRTLRERMKTVVEKITWLPSFGLDREMDWLTNMHDWLISKKNRYWGLALPIWECPKCHSFQVIGSYEELEEKAVSGWKEFVGKTPHKPQIDEVKIKCTKCAGIMNRIEPVGNPWLDAGIVPFSTISENNKACGWEPSNTKPLYLEDRDEWHKWFPVDFITESFPGQFKNWFYAMIAMSTVLEDTNPYKTVLGFGTLLGEDGRAMHKSWGNSIEFGEGADKIGVDVMRWIFSRANPAENMLFGYKLADEVRRRFHLKLWNVYNFFVTYANLDGWKPSVRRKPGRVSNTLDKWILVRLDQTLNQVTKSLEEYDAADASAEIEKFVDDLSIWYIRRSRDRVGPAKQSEKDAKAFYTVTHYVLYTLAKIMAPFTPFMSEMIYTNLTREDSVHLADWPNASSKIKARDLSLVESMQKAREIVEKVHAKRKEKGIPVRQPLTKVEVKGAKIKDRDVEKILLEEVNIKKIDYLGKEGEIEVELDTKLTPELEKEAEVRDIVRKIQAERKKMGLDLTQKVDVTMNNIPESKGSVQWIMKKSQIANLKKGAFEVKKSS